ncbi:MAG: type II toxin-antitoxin system VapC family toxin [Planctomycetes bacterium]|nr:type II toxin-antitoxin system VapC family toxin [Planctomycetota bacterium]
MMYLLDSNVWVALLRGSVPLVATRFQVANPADLRVCSVVVAELRYGCARSAKPVANRATVDVLLAPFPSLPFDEQLHVGDV